MLVYWQHFVHEWQELQFAAVSVFNSSSSMVVIWRWTVAKFLTEVLFHWLVFWVLEYSYDTADWYACVCVHVCMYAAVCSVITSLCHDITMSCIQLRWHWVSWLHYLATGRLRDVLLTTAGFLMSAIKYHQSFWKIIVSVLLILLWYCDALMPIFFIIQKPSNRTG